MDVLPPIVLECPECGEKYLISRQSENPSEKAIRFSDGFYVDQINWRTPMIIGCITCELGFFPENGKLIAEPDWDEFQHYWSDLKKAEPPTAGALAIELRVRKKLLPEKELALRTEFWYAGNHSELGRMLKLKNEKFRNYWTESLVQLERIIPDASEDSLLLKAEINRQLGEFDKCITLINDHASVKAKQVIEYAMAQKTEPFVLIFNAN